MKKTFFTKTLFNLILFLVGIGAASAQNEKYIRKFTTLTNPAWLDIKPDGHLAVGYTNSGYGNNVQILNFLDGSIITNYYLHDYQRGVAAASNGNIYVASPYQGRSLDVLYPNGSSAVQSEYGFYSPSGLSIDENTGLIYGLDKYDSSIKIVNPITNTITKIVNSNNHLVNPASIVVSKDFIFVTDNGGIQKFNINGDHMLTFGNSGLGTLTPSCNDLAILDNILYVVDSPNNRIMKYGLEGNFIGKFGTTGNGDGQFNFPIGITINSQSKEIFVTDNHNNRIQVFKEAICPYHLISKFEIAPRKVRNYTEESEKGLAIGSDGKIYVCNSETNKIEVYNPDYSLYTTFGKEGTSLPSEIAIDQNGNIFIFDNTYKISKYNANYEFINNSVDLSYTKFALGPNGDIYAAYKNNLENNTHNIIRLNNSFEYINNFIYDINISAIAVDLYGNMFVSEDKGLDTPDRVLKFNTNGTFMGEVEIIKKVSGLVTNNAGQLFIELLYGDVDIYTNNLEFKEHFDNDRLLSRISSSISLAPNGHIFTTGYYRDLDQNNNLIHRVSVFEYSNNCNLPTVVSRRQGSTENIKEITKALTVSPNPSTDNFNLTFAENGTHEIVMYSSTGVEVLRKTIEGREVNISEPGLENGLYTIHETSNGVTNKVKFVIAK